MAVEHQEQYIVMLIFSLSFWLAIVPRDVSAFGKDISL
jgi:hypothetical protein